MITPGELAEPLIIYMGATFNPTITWNDGVIGNPVDLTGYTADMKIRPWLGSDEIIAELSTGNGGIAINEPTNGTASLLITAAASSNLSPVNAVFDLQLIGEGQTDYLLSGAIQIQQMVTA